MLEYLGWTATLVFVSSYLCTQGARLRLVQGMGASLWVLYGLAIRAWPVVAANVLVLIAAVWTTTRGDRPQVSS
jgi:hypothetical protein